MKRCPTATKILFACVSTTVADAHSPTFQRNDIAATATSSPRSVVTAEFNLDGRPDLPLSGIDSRDRVFTVPRL
jgi:hypothetical protein